MQDSDEPELRGYARISLNGFFIDIAKRSFFDYERHLKTIGELKSQGGFDIEDGEKTLFLYHKQDEIHRTDEEMTKSGISAIVFLAIYCEAFIWDLGASVLGDNYAQKYLEKLDTISKWVLIPKLITGKSIPPSHHSLEKLKELIKWRNRFVHSKSKDGSNLVRQPELFQKDFLPMNKQVDIRGLFKGIEDLFLELAKVDPDGYHRFKI